MAYLPYLSVAIFVAVLIVLNERHGLFSQDRFISPFAKIAGYVWLAAILFLIAGFVGRASAEVPSAADLAQIPFWTVFTLHLVLVIFLVGWWLMTGMPPIRQFLSVREDALHGVAIGIGVGVAGWAVTLMVALAAGLLLSTFGFAPEDLKPSPMIPWMAALPLWQKATIVLSAMTVEEAFFRGWLQKRIGLIASTVLFAVGHAGYGQPFMLIGVTIVSLVIGYTFYRTRNLVPCIVAHGVFDAIQLFVIVPLALKIIPPG